MTRLLFIKWDSCMHSNAIVNQIFYKKILGNVNNSKSVMEFVKSFTIKDAIWCTANAWNSISSEIVNNAQSHLLSPTIFKEDDAIDFEGFSRKKSTITGLGKSGECEFA